MAKVFVLGHRGMLGHVVHRLLKECGHDVCTSDKRFQPGPNPELLDDVARSNTDVIVNCIGKIRQKGQDPTESYLINTILPIQLTQQLADSQKFIQISTDCVFSGKNLKGYKESDLPDADDVYGSSKSLAETIQHKTNVFVLRTSIIGPEIQTSFGLMSWFLNNNQEKIDGYVNHFWNGVTTLELAKTINGIATVPSRSWGVTHVVSCNAVSKAELLETINEVFDCKKIIMPFRHSQTINRTLLSGYFGKSKNIREQLIELKDWYYK